MSRIPICTINMSEGEGRQIISWDSEDFKLYSSAQEEPCDDYRYDSIEEATIAAGCMWGNYFWELEWLDTEDEAF